MSVSQLDFDTPGAGSGEPRQVLNQRRRRSGYFNVTSSTVAAGGDVVRQLQRLQNQSSSANRSDGSPNRSPGSINQNGSPPRSIVSRSYPSEQHDRGINQFRTDDNRMVRNSLLRNDRHEGLTPSVRNSARRTVDISGSGQAGQSIHHPNVSDRN